MIRDMESLAMKPVPNKWIVTFPYGVTYTGTRKKHKGVDYSCPKGTSVNSVVAGKVVFAGWHKVGRGWVAATDYTSSSTMIDSMTGPLVYGQAIAT